MKTVLLYLLFNWVSLILLYAAISASNNRQALSIKERSKNRIDESEFEMKFAQSLVKICSAKLVGSGRGLRPCESLFLIISRAVSGTYLYPFDAKHSSMLVLPPPGPPVTI